MNAARAVVVLCVMIDVVSSAQLMNTSVLVASIIGAIASLTCYLQGRADEKRMVRS